MEERPLKEYFLSDNLKGEVRQALRQWLLNALKDIVRAQRVDPSVSILYSMEIENATDTRKFMAIAGKMGLSDADFREFLERNNYGKPPAKSKNRPS